MIERQHGRIILVCDGCDDTIEGEKGDDLQTVVTSAKGENWQIKPDGEGGWEHHCAGCKRRSHMDAQRRLLGL